ncbi:hypothetical protein BRADI_3g60446v3 [Brachypodium distachyon]|uniref:Uncharacterized protein n=1 Tax=Brachypodium distachyon TaxID=15368 RepID=A0A2K2D626_BRADI|nr:hypothetical protein BRADI_3g60446v3 [Brachypodium distachyon]
MTSYSSRVITTTRMNNVAHSCCSSFSDHIYNIRPLGIVHSRQLFHRRLFNPEEDCFSYLEEVSEHILEKCAGLPLAIIAISGLLANIERTEGMWNQVKESMGHALERNCSVERMMRIFSLSYFDLPPRLKTCLLYLSIFPEDSIIESKDLIRRWIAEGFIHKEGRYTVSDLGERCFNELLNRSLIQPVKKDRYGNVKSCRVHDTVLDFINSKSTEENFVTLFGVPNLTVGTQGKVRRISLQVGKQGNCFIPTGLALSHVRSLSVFGDSVEIPFLDKFRHLRVLDFGGCYQLENHHLADIGRLFLLRYLNLRGTEVSELPEQISNLGCLEMLDLRSTMVHELPASIVSLKRLVHLFVDNDVTFPCGIAKMQALEMLKSVYVFKQTFNFLQELGQLKNLRKLLLDFQGDSAIGDTTGVHKEECRKSIVSSLGNLGRSENLGSLVIWEGGSFLQQGPMCPVPLSIHKLMTYRSRLPQVPKWVSSLLNLRSLCLQVEAITQEDFCILGALPALLILYLSGAAESKEGLRVSGEVGFRFLRMFRYYVKDGGMGLMFAVGGMPKLEKLAISTFFESSESESITISSDFGIRNLPCLITVRFNTNRRDKNIEATKAAMEEAASTHPNHPTVRFGIANSFSVKID